MLINLWRTYSEAPYAHLSFFSYTQHMQFFQMYTNIHIPTSLDDYDQTSQAQTN